VQNGFVPVRREFSSRSLWSGAAQMHEHVAERCLIELSPLSFILIEGGFEG
jgi:hypothetical protein